MVQLNAASRLRAYTFPAIDDHTEDLLGLLGALHTKAPVRMEDFFGVKAATAEVPQHVTQLKTQLDRLLFESRLEPFEYEGQDYVAFSTKAVEEFPGQGRLSGLVAVVLESSRNGTTIRVMPWMGFRKLQRS